MTVWFDEGRGKWRYHFQLRKQRYTGYCVHPATEIEATNRTEAKAIERQIRAAIERAADAPAGGDVEPGEDEVYTLAQAFAVWKPRKEPMRNWVNLKIYARELLAWFGPATPVTEPDTDRIWEYIEWARKQPIMVWRGGGMTPKQAAERGIAPEKLWKKTDRLRSDSTINRYLDVIREVFGIAAKTKDKKTGQPRLPCPPEVPELEEPGIDPNPISDEDLLAIIAAARAAHLFHIADAAFLVRNMGFRKAEVFGIKLTEVSHNRQGIVIPAERTKNKRETFIPANEAAWREILRLVAQAKHWRSEHLINYRGVYPHADGKVTYGKPRPITNPDRAWHKALKLAGLEGRYIFHNTKASFVTEHAAKNSAKLTKEAARHGDQRTTDRYIKFASKRMRQAMQEIEFQLPDAEQSASATADPHTVSRTRRRRKAG